MVLTGLLILAAQLGTPLLSIDSADSLRQWYAGSSTTALGKSGHGLAVTFKPAEWPSVLYKPNKPMDWSTSGYLAFDVTNPGSTPATFGVRVDDDPSANGFEHSRQGMSIIEPGRTATYVLAVGLDPKKYGMNGVPGPKNVRSMGSSGGTTYDTSHIISMQFFMHLPTSATTLTFDNLRLLPTIKMTGIVDKYGQYTGETWPGKITADEEFAKRRALENAELNRQPQLEGRDQYGGLDSKTPLKATGFFRTEKVDGRWWLVDPEGHVFFSVGVDTVNNNLGTFVTGRESMFTDLPKPTDPFGQFFAQESTDHGGKHVAGNAYQFYQANLLRKLGPEWKHEFNNLALRRFPSWGFNTVGNFSDFSVYRNGKVPYVCSIWVGNSFKGVPSGNDYWGLMHDPFDPQFRTEVRKNVALMSGICKNDPWCVGYFVDNELSWSGQGPEDGRYGLAIGAMGYGTESPAKNAFVDQLRKKYPSVADLNRAWETSFSDWEQVKQPAKGPWKFGDGQKKDMAAFVYSLSDTYHRVVSEELKKADPDHLYLGCRFAWYGRDAVEAAAKYSDVLSFNVYSERPERAKWDWLNALNKPVIIGEFHFGSTDRGMFHPGLVDARSQANRGAMYIDYVTTVAQNPCFVGCHWFQYIDEPLTGRTLDGENYNVGFVDVTDTPYPELVAAARKVHAEMYKIHAKAK